MQTKEYHQQWCEKNKDKVKAKNKKWRDANKDKERARAKKWQENNKDKATANVVRWKKSNPDKIKNNSLKRRYGVSLGLYNEMLAVQNDLCYICAQPETLKYKGKIRLLCVDHNHETGEIRKLLCDSCNQGIAKFKENIKYLDEAKSYLIKFNHGGE